MKLLLNRCSSSGVLLAYYSVQMEGWSVREKLRLLHIRKNQSSSSRSLSSSPRWSRSAFSVAQRMFFITFCAVM